MLAEGIYWLLDQGMPVVSADRKLARRGRTRSRCWRGRVHDCSLTRSADGTPVLPSLLIQ